MSDALIPIFPLQIVVFPDEVVNLHIFETRYKQLITEAEAHDTPFGIPTYIKDSPLSYGTEVTLERIAKKYDDGKLDISVKGQRIIKVDNFIPRMPNRLYSGADISYVPFDRKIDHQLNKEILSLLSKLYEYLKLHKPLPANEYSFDSYRIGHYIGLPLKEELKLLSIEKEADRQSMILEHLESILPVLGQMNELEKRVKMNGHFKNIIPPSLD